MTDTITAAGPITSPLERFRMLIASTVTFQTWTNLALPSAKDRVYVARGANLPTMPHCVVGHDRLRIERGEMQAMNEYPHHIVGTFYCLFRAKTPDGLNSHDAEFTFTNTVGQILIDAIVLGSRDPEYLSIGGFEAIGPPAELAPEQVQTAKDASGAGSSWYEQDFRVPFSEMQTVAA